MTGATKSRATINQRQQGGHVDFGNAEAQCIGNAEAQRSKQ